VQRIVGRGLVGHHVGLDAALDQLGEDLPGVAEQPDRNRLAGLGRPPDHLQRLVQIVGLHVQVAGLEPLVDARGPALDREQGGAGHGRGQRLGATHAAQAAGQDPLALQVAAVVLAAGLDEGLVGALDDALATDVDPRAGGHLAVHHQPGPVELVEVLPGRPVRHQVGVGDQHPRRVAMGFEHADRLARLHQQGLVAVEFPERADDGVEAAPIARRPADAAVDHQLLGLLRHLGVEVVHDHPKRRFGQPGLGGEFGPARRADLAAVVDAGILGHGVPPPFAWRGWIFERFRAPPR